MFTLSLLLFLACTSLIEARSLHQVSHVHNAVRRQADSTILSPEAIQNGSFLDGSQQFGAKAGQSKSLTSRNNFINHCDGSVLTNGFQNTEGSCNGIVMGDIPAKNNMVSSIITFPEHASASIKADTTFNITVQIANLVTGVFTNADVTYYSAPQFLQGGKIVGHAHVTVADLGASLNPATAPDATKFSFFKGINDDGNGRGLLTATVTGGLPAGNYRVCTICSAANHQAVVMPVAQRQSAEDCTKFTVIGSGTTINAASNGGSKGIAAAELAQSALEAGPGFIVASSTAATNTTTGDLTKATTPPFSNSTATRTGGNGGKGSGKGNGGGKGKTTSIDQRTSSAAAVETSNVAGNGGGKDVSTPEAASTTVSATTSKTNGGGKGSKTTSASSGKATGKRIITIIETFFAFEKFRGGACPSVSKSGNQFKVLEEFFDDLASAAAAACGQQFTECASFSGPGFSIEECGSQRDECASVASTQSATATTPTTLTASVTIPVSATATVPGSVVATETITPVASKSTSAAAGNDKVITTKSHAVQTTAPAASSFCSVVTETVTVQAPAHSTASSLPRIVSSKALFSNSTATASSISKPFSITSSTGAIGGSEHPPSSTQALPLTHSPSTKTRS